jgi:hypothetical protein
MRPVGSLENRRGGGRPCDWAIGRIHFFSLYSSRLDPARLRRYLTEATAVKTTWFDYEPGERRFRYYTLLSLSPVLAQPDVVRALSN